MCGITKIDAALPESTPSAPALSPGGEKAKKGSQTTNYRISSGGLRVLKQRLIKPPCLLIISLPAGTDARVHPRKGDDKNRRQLYGTHLLSSCETFKADRAVLYQK